MTNPKRKDLLSLSLIFILSSTLFDFINLPFGELWLNIHLFLKDLMYIGFSMLCYIQTPFKQLKLKTLLFMLTVWRIAVIMINTIGLADNFYSLSFIAGLYIIFIIWLLRIQLMPTKLVQYTGSEIQKKALTYNVFVPVHSVKGIIKALLLINTDPRYETTLLVHKDRIYYIKNKMFYFGNNRIDVLEKFVEKTTSMISIKSITPRQERKVKDLLYKRAIPGIRDCQNLKI